MWFWHPSYSKSEGSMYVAGDAVTPWLQTGMTRGDVTTTSLLSAGPLPLNSVDVQADVLLAVSDNEALYVIRNVILY